MRLVGLVLALAFPLCVRAGGWDGKTYVAARVGVAQVAQSDPIVTSNAVTLISGRDDTDVRVPWLVAIGRRLDQGRWRVELEYADRQESSLRVDTTGSLAPPGPTYSARTDLAMRSRSLMFNGYWELSRKRLKPYVTFGGGWFFNTVRATRIIRTPAGTGPFQDDTAWAELTRGDLAWSVGGGASYELCPRLDLDLTLRHVDLGKYDTGADTVHGTEVIQAGVASNEAVVGLRYGF